MAPKRIGVMTSGDDSPGMNAVVRAVVRMAIYMGCDPFVIYEGYEGLIRGGAYIKKMGNMVLNGIDTIIVCGGDGSLAGADKFRSEWPTLLDELIVNRELSKSQVAPYGSLKVVGIVGSIDNDLPGTDATVGCYSALSRICELVDFIEATASSHSRAFVIEVMGRHCGWLALSAGVATGADFVLIPERPQEHDWREDMRDVVKKHREIGKRKTIVIVAEGARGKDGAKITPEQIKNLLADKNKGGLGLDTRITTPGHVQRGGTAVAFDRMLGTLQGIEAVKAVLEATPEMGTCFIAIQENKIVRRPLMKATQDVKELAAAIMAEDFEKAMSLRDAEFAGKYQSYLTTTNVLMDDVNLPPKSRMKIGFINVGAPAGGMNAAVRAAVAYCIGNGHEPVAVHNGFAGFARHHDDQPVGSVRPFDWLEVDSWASKGGSEIGTNCELPSESGMELVANLIEQYEFDALFIVGGFEAFTSVAQLRKAREEYPSLCIPICLLPATISNNIPGTEYTLGSDTCLNELINYCDKIKQSASATRRRVFVVETQGDRSGYIATLCGLCVGASAVYIPEKGISLAMLNADVKHLEQAFDGDRGQSGAGRLIIVNEKASNVYDAKLIANIIHEEAYGHFESRVSIPGHVQQGGVPSAMDRCHAVRLAIKCIEHLESFGRGAHNRAKKDPSSAAVIGIQGSEVVFTPIKRLEEQNTDWQNRRPNAAHWLGSYEIGNILGGRPRVLMHPGELAGSPTTPK
ncbi:6-phosphofructokinase beta subunit [Purpureocillium lilacinum]|uniref:6-phosphofructokinase n=1 Tax=Purpureocillium lilacinum TaxID=33203 RepID=A0A179FJL5_PURLI|nr:6-phosphofructokinase beta subunit [Purpureocillium lilacinum]